MESIRTCRLKKVAVKLSTIVLKNIFVGGMQLTMKTIHISVLGSLLVKPMRSVGGYFLVPDNHLSKGICTAPNYISAIVEYDLPLQRCLHVEYPTFVRRASLADLIAAQTAALQDVRMVQNFEKSLTEYRLPSMHKDLF